MGRVIGFDTESHGGVAFSIQVSVQCGTALMVRLSDCEAADCLARHVNRLLDAGYELALHHAVADLDILDAIGIKYQGRFTDTLQGSYHLGNLPQGLKPLVYRLFGHTMTSWEDVVRPYSIEALLAWMIEAREIAVADLSLIELKKLKTKTKEIVKRGPLETLLDRLIQHTDTETDYDPWDRLGEFWADDTYEWMTSHIEARVGTYPILGIGNAPLAKAVEYACGDADWTGQVAAELRRRRAEPVWKIDERDRDQ